MAPDLSGFCRPRVVGIGFMLGFWLDLGDGRSTTVARLVARRGLATQQWRVVMTTAEETEMAVDDGGRQLGLKDKIRVRV
ncbi:hypothetical protein V6N13_042887 [Hibiscus sabdariffa]